MYIKGIDNRIFKNFNNVYLIELIKLYPNKSIEQKIYDDINKIKKELNVQLLSNLNIQYWIIRGWTENEAKEIIIQLKNKRKKPKHTCLQKKFWVSKGLTEEEAIKKISEIQRNNCKKFNIKRKKHPENYKTSSPMTIEFWINKGLTEEEAKYKIKSQRKLNEEYWIKKGFSKEESIQKISEFQLEQSKKIKPENHGKSLRIEYWINKGFSEEEAKILLKDRQTTFSLEKCIRKLGAIDGLKRWQERQNNWKKKVFNSKTCISSGFSMLSNNIINEIKKYDNSKILYGKEEKFIYDKIYKRAYKYDILKLENKKIIEINGIFWHCKPTLYKEDHFHKVRKMTAKEIWEFDQRKNEIAKQYGYDVLVIWEDDYYNDPNKVIMECINFLK